MTKPKFETAEAAAIRKFMRNRRAQLRRPEARQYPKPGTFTSTKDYVEKFTKLNASIAVWAASPVNFYEPLNDKPFTQIDGDEVVVENLEHCKACGVTL